jgi:mono/diheme cytochrome c family protein/uncharacterized membrane protein
MLHMMLAVEGTAWIEALGRFHVVIVHFPIALLLVAGFAELWRTIRRAPTASPTAITCLWLGGLSAIVAAVFGWFHLSEFGADAEPTRTQQFHQWLGIAAAALALVALFALLFRKRTMWPYRLATITCALVVGTTAHLGGTLTHGDGYLTELLFKAQDLADVPMGPAPTPIVQVISFPSDGKIDFAKHVQPIFAKSCYDCHSATKKRGGLRLDSKSMFFEGGNTGKEILPGKSAESLLLKRVRGQGNQKRMPVDHPPLTDDQIKILASWVDQGATWPDTLTNDAATKEKHWAYEKPVRPKLPEVTDKAWVKNGIDAFVLARLEKEGLKPSPEADRPTLIRRLSLDLTGLPPKPEEVDSFVNDPRPDAYDRLVDKLLASPHYGERWGRHWLDIARYADTNGYEKDNGRIIWPYRDWVIKSINEDLPYDQFVIQQIAGDMLPGATADQKIATGFHRNTMFNEEGGIDVEEFRFKAVVDRVQTTSTAFLGLTMQCAQCHNHKYDAISQKEYYQFFSMLNNADEPDYKIPSKEVTAKRQEIQQQVTKLESEYQSKFPYFEQKNEFKPLKPTTQKSASNVKLILQPDGSLLAKGKKTDKDTYTVEATADTTGMTMLRVEALSDDSLPKKGPGRAPNGNFVLSEIKVVTTQPTTKPFAIASATADFQQPEYEVAKAIDNNPATGWAVAQAGDIVQPSIATFTFKEKLPDGQTKLVVTLDQQYSKHQLGRFRLSLGRAAPPPPSTQPIEVQRSNLIATKQSEWEKSVAAKCAKWTVVEPAKYSRLHDATITKLDDQSLLFTGDSFYREEYKLDYKVPQKDVTAIRLEALRHEDLEKGGPGRDPNGGGLLSELSAIAAPATQPATTRPVVFEKPTADFSPETVANAIDGKRDTHWSVGGGANRTAVFPIKDKLTDNGGSILSLSIVQNQFSVISLGRIRISVTTDPNPQASGIPPEVEAIVLIPQKDRTPEQSKKLNKYFLSITPLLAPQHQEVAQLRATMPQFQTTLVMKERSTPRITKIHHRGEYLQEKDPVTAGVPATLPPLADDGPKDRLALAKWLVDPENPLVGRVTMNRMWSTYFGRGIVNTLDDFGIMGEKPSHPQLLDWLATELPRQHWSMKAMHKLIVTSATYRQASRVTPELQQKDPQNVLLTRGPRLRVEAEVVRDIALTASGLLSEKVGGPSVFPPQPPGIENLSYGAVPWVTSTGEEKYRRGLYTYLKRTALYPGLTTFDAPTAEVTCTRRIRSNTPLQALTTLNDTVFMEASQQLARRLIKSALPDPDSRIREAFRLCTARAPDEKELTQVKTFYESQLKRFKDKAADPMPVAAVDPKNPPTDMDINELAAWTTVSRAILNLDETVTRE